MIIIMMINIVLLFVFQGKTLVTGSLDVLESVGKKAYDVIAEGDHGLKKTIERAGNKTNLSQVSAIH